MPQFKVTYPSGVVDQEIVQDCETVEAFINRKFGSVDVHEHGVKVEMMEDDEQPTGVNGTSINTDDEDEEEDDA